MDGSNSRRDAATLSTPFVLMTHLFFARHIANRTLCRVLALHSDRDTLTDGPLAIAMQHSSQLMGAPENSGTLVGRIGQRIPLASFSVFYPFSTIPCMESRSEVGIRHTWMARLSNEKAGLRRFEGEDRTA